MDSDREEDGVGPAVVSVVQAGQVAGLDLAVASVDLVDQVGGEDPTVSAGVRVVMEEPVDLGEAAVGGEEAQASDPVAALGGTASNPGNFQKRNFGTCSVQFFKRNENPDAVRAS